MQRVMIRFRTQPFYLLAYFGAQLLLMIAVLYVLVAHTDAVARLYQPFQWWGLCLLPLTLVGGLQAPVLMHNCVHHNLRYGWLNRVVGELIGIYILLGMEAFALNHAMHHAFADTALDPHNPRGKSFCGYIFSSNFAGTTPVRQKYLEYHGNTVRHRVAFQLILAAHFLNAPVRLMFWLLLLGPSLFVTVFLPSFLFQSMVFAHVNFATHTVSPGGRANISNLNGHWYFKLINALGSGIYFHRNHHQQPGVFNPSDLVERSKAAS